MSTRFGKIAVIGLVGVLLCGALALAGCSQGTSASSASSSSASSTASSESSASASSSSSSSQASTSAASSASSSSSQEADGPYASGTHHALVTVDGYDPFTIELDADAAPITVANFCELANAGYYDGLNFYRFVPDFCMQGGTKGNTASGNDSSLTPIVGEFSGNGYDNPLADNFEKGVVAMARTSDPDSATSTFFVTLGSGSSVSGSLNGQYAAFGTIDDAGMEIVDQIVVDYAPNVTDASMGVISIEENQAKIASIEIVD